MSTIKSSNEHLTLNADGSGKDIKFQSNGSEIASISDGGVVTATSYAGSGANLTNIPATDISGKLNLSGGTMTGTIAGFTSTGIDDNADATAMTISSSEKVRVGPTNQTDKALLSTWQDNTDAGTSIGGTNLAIAMQHYGGANSVVQMGLGYCVNHPPAVIGYKVETNSNHTKGDIFFATRDDTADIAPTERMRINVSGKVNIGGTDTVGHLNVERTTAGAVVGVWNSHSDGVLMQWFSPAGSNRGSISVSGSSTSYNTSSDYRLKENVDYTWDATTRLKQLKPARFNFIEDDTNTLVDGFIAHEAATVVPEAVTGTKDAMTAEVLYVEGDELPDGKSIGDVKEASVPDMQGIDQSKLVPLLVKTIQELEARITALEA